MFKRIAAIILICSMVLTLFACGKGDAEKETTTASTTAASAETDDNTTTDADDEKIEYNGKMPKAFTATKVGSIGMISSLNDPSNGNVEGVYYRLDDKYGVMSFDGKYDTGAKYITCKHLDNYFAVSDTDTTSATEVSELNSVGLINFKGEELIPMQYASIDVLNDRYAKVVTVTEVTDNKDDALVFFTDKVITIGASDDDLLLAGKWEIFDMTTGKVIEGVSGTKPYIIYAYGNVVEYGDDNGKKVYVNEKGETLKERGYFGDGYYREYGSVTTKVCDYTGKELFSYDNAEYRVDGQTGEFFSARKHVGDGLSDKYVLMDKTGKVVTAEMSESIYIKGDLLKVDGKLYTFDGTKVSPDSYEFSGYDEVFGCAWAVEDEGKTIVIDSQGNICAEFDEAEGEIFYPTVFVGKKNIGNGALFYSHKELDFVIDGNLASNWIVKGVDEAVYDTVSGKKIIDGYSYYKFIEVNGEGIYVYAAKDSETIDIYLIK